MNFMSEKNITADIFIALAQVDMIEEIKDVELFSSICCPAAVFDELPRGDADALFIKNRICQYAGS